MSLSLAARLPGSHRPRVALLAAFAMIAVALVLGLRLVWQPYAASSSVPVQASLDEAATSQDRIEHASGAGGQRTQGGGDYLSQFNAPILSGANGQPLAALVRQQRLWYPVPDSNR